MVECESQRRTPRGVVRICAQFCQQSDSGFVCIYRTSLSLGRFWYIHLPDKTFKIYLYIKQFDYIRTLQCFHSFLKYLVCFRVVVKKLYRCFEFEVFFHCDGKKVIQMLWVQDEISYFWLFCIKKLIQFRTNVTSQLKLI